MKNFLFLSALFLFLDLPVYSQSTIDLKILSQSTDSIELTDGTKISYTEFKKICQKAWDNSFGKMSENDKKYIFLLATFWRRNRISEKISMTS